MRGSSPIFVVLGVATAVGCSGTGDDRGASGASAGTDSITTSPGGSVSSGSESGGTSEGTSDDSSSGDPSASGGSATTGNTTDNSTGGPGTKFDLGPVPDAAAVDPGECSIPQHIPCDDLDDDIWHAIGVNCPGELVIDATFNGQAQQTDVVTGQLGTYNPATFPVREGEKMLVLSSGVAAELNTVVYMSTDVNGIGALPAPISTNPVSAFEDCAANPALVGTGDCSNTIDAQWNQGSGANDLAEMRMELTVPQGAYGFSYDLAFFSTEYPVFYQSGYNDMYIAWLESELWTGNISFDDMGNPISLNAGFLDFKDDGGNLVAFEGTCMRQHAGTRWLTTTAGVVPGEDVTIVFAIFDLSDSILDSYAFLDNFQWGCDGEEPPSTVPID
jgi:hypothetical protein